MTTRCWTVFGPLWKVDPANRKRATVRARSSFVGTVAASVAQDRNPRRFEQIIGNSPALESVLEQVEQVAPTDSSVLIQGETCTGHALIPRAIHNLSARW